MLLSAGKVLPLEILPLGEFDPVYRSTLDIQNGELPVLPLSIYGAVSESLPSFAHVAGEKEDVHACLLCGRFC